MPHPDVIAAALRDGGIVQAHEPLRLEALPRNPERSDAFHKQTFRVFRDGAPWCFLTVAPDLSDLERRAHLFAEACPGLACRTVVASRVAGWGVLGTEWFDGENLEAHAARGAISSDQLAARVRHVRTLLAASSKPSDVAAAQAEMDQFARRVLDCPVFSEESALCILQEWILPWLRERAGASARETRVTNGDFVARNLLLSARGESRLIDCEFAERTHFFAADRWRWRTFSRLPAEMLTLDAEDSAALDAWIEVYAILQHILLAYTAQGLTVALAEAEARMPRLFDVAAAERAAPRAGPRWNALRVPRNGTSPTVAAKCDIAQLFWSESGAFNEPQSRRIHYERASSVDLRFLIPQITGRVFLRLDPGESPGLILLERISGIRIAAGVETPLFVSEPPALQVAAVSGVMLLAHQDEVAVLCLNHDPQIGLPALELGSGVCDVVIVVRLHGDEDLSALPRLLNS